MTQQVVQAVMLFLLLFEGHSLGAGHALVFDVLGMLGVLGEFCVLGELGELGVLGVVGETDMLFLALVLRFRRQARLWILLAHRPILVV